MFSIQYMKSVLFLQIELLQNRLNNGLTEKQSDGERKTKQEILHVLIHFPMAMKARDGQKEDKSLAVCPGFLYTHQQPESRGCLWLLSQKR